MPKLVSASDSEEQLAVPTDEQQGTSEHVNLDTSLDADAEGDVDPDYVSEQPSSAVDLDGVEGTSAAAIDELKADTSKDGVDGDGVIVPDIVEVTGAVTTGESEAGNSADGVSKETTEGQHVEAGEANVITYATLTFPFDCCSPFFSR